MHFTFRAAASAAAPFCLLAGAAISAPSLAETPTGPSGGAVVLASLSTPNVASDVPSDADVSDPNNQDPAGFTTPLVYADDEKIPDPATATTLADLVAARATSQTADAEHECMAATVYFEAKGEPLEGQLAVAQTLAHRAASGRFPTSVCGVMRQHGQFSFVRGGALPAIPRASVAWEQAVAVASIVRDGVWKEVAPAALFFHASSVAPSWHGMTRIARLGNQIFYR